jgi:hypothetical protein
MFKQFSTARNQTDLEKPVEKVDAKYIGGHKAFPKSKDTSVLIFSDKIEVEKLGLSIPYKSMINIENSNAEKITKTRVVLLGIVGLLWKKKYLYTIVDYDDGIDKQSVVLDFHRDVDKVQPLLYHKMLDARK